MLAAELPPMPPFRSDYHGATPVPKDVAAKLEAEQKATIKYPADGKYMGDWKLGERIAQTGVGMQYSDDPKAPSGGNCYACHELTKAELAFGTIGPSLRIQAPSLRSRLPRCAKAAAVSNPRA